LDVNAPVAKYWPEFAQQGKENVLVRHILSHTSGLPAWDDVHPFEALFEWDKMVGLLERQKPWWKPGEKSGYHGTTFGFLLGEVVRRISGITIGNFFRQEIAEEIGADFHIGLAEKHAHRVAQLTFSAPREIEDHDSIAFRVMNNIEPGNIKSRAAQAAEMPASSGYGNARSIALTGAIIANGGELSGKRFLSRNTIEMIFNEQSYREDLVLGAPVRYGLGLGINSREFPFPNPNTCSWGGYGGSVCIMDVDARLCMAYAMNYCSPDIMDDPRNIQLMEALRDVIKHI
jgi:CubicO group peptidase (beta-lactamase class C family)